MSFSFPFIFLYVCWCVATEKHFLSLLRCSGCSVILSVCLSTEIFRTSTQIPVIHSKKYVSFHHVLFCFRFDFYLLPTSSRQFYHLPAVTQFTIPIYFVLSLRFFRRIHSNLLFLLLALTERKDLLTIIYF